MEHCSITFSCRILFCCLLQNTVYIACCCRILFYYLLLQNTVSIAYSCRILFYWLLLQNTIMLPTPTKFFSIAYSCRILSYCLLLQNTTLLSTTELYSIAYSCRILFYCILLQNTGLLPTLIELCFRQLQKHYMLFCQFLQTFSLSALFFLSLYMPTFLEIITPICSFHTCNCSV